MNAFPSVSAYGLLASYRIGAYALRLLILICMSTSVHLLSQVALFTTLRIQPSQTDAWEAAWMLEPCLRLYLRVYDFNYPEQRLDLCRDVEWTYATSIDVH